MKLRALLALVVSACTQPPRVPVQTPARAAKDQAEALRLARMEDLPALEAADRVLLAEARGRRRVVVDRPAEVAALRRALRVVEVPPSAGETAWTLSFFQGDRAIREVWVYPYGEWGFVRPETPSWTIGRDDGLAAAIRKLLE